MQHNGLCNVPDRSSGHKVVFPSVKHVAELKTSVDILIPYLYDRINQLLVWFAALQQLAGGLWDKFKAACQAQEFAANNTISKEGGWRQWPIKHPNLMNDNFRDLEKLAIRWHNRRLLGRERRCAPRWPHGL